MRRGPAVLLAGALIILGAPGLAHASDYDGRDRDGGYSYRHHRDSYQGDSYQGDSYQNHDDGDGYRDDGHRGERNGNDGDCQSGGCNNRSSRCRGSQGDCRSSFSPGPFDHSPVIIWFCPQQNSCNNQDGSGSPPEEQKPK